MAIDVVVKSDRVKEIREKLDPLASFPPTVGTNEAVPGSTFLSYNGVENEPKFIATAMANGASVNR